MKIGEYQQMISHLTRPPAPKTQVTNLVDDLEPGPLKDELQDKFDPSQETYEEYLQRKGLGERPFNAANGGSPKEEIVEPPKSMQVDTTTRGIGDPLEDFKEKADRLLQGSFASTNKDFFNNLIEQEYQKALDAGVQPQEALSFIKERSQMYRTLADEGRRQGEPTVLGPTYNRQNKEAGGVVQRQNYGKGDYVKALNSLIESGDTSYENIPALKDKIEEIVGTRPGGSFQLGDKTYGNLLENFKFENFATRSKVGDPEAYKISDKNAQQIVDNLNKEYDFIDEKGLPKKGVKFSLAKTKQGKNTLLLQPNTSIYENFKRTQRAFDEKGLEKLKKIADEIIETDTFKNYDKGRSYKNIGRKSAITQLRNDGSKQDLIFDYILKSKKPVGLVELAKKFELSPKLLKRDLRLLYENIVKKGSGKGGAFLPDDLDQLNIVRDKMKEIPDVNLRRDAVKNLVFDAYKGDADKLESMLTKVDNYYKLQSKIPDKYKDIFTGQLDHIVPLSFLKQVDEGEDPLNLIRVQPIPTIINQKSFKGNFDTALAKAQRTGDKEALKVFGELKKYLPEEFGGVTPSGKVSDFVVGPLDEKRSLTEQQKKFGEVYDRVLKFIDNPKVKPLLKKIGINPETSFQVLRGSGQLMRKNLPGFLNTFEKILQKNPDLRVELGDEFSEIQNQYASLNLEGDVRDFVAKQEEKKKDPFPYEAALPGSVILGRYGPQVLNVLKNIGVKPFGSVTAGLGYTASELASEDPSYGLAGAEMLLPEVTGAASKAANIQNRFGRFLLNPFTAISPSAATVVPKIMTRVGVPVMIGGGIMDIAKASQPDFLLDKETGEPMAFDREDASFVMPTMIDANEQASKLAKEKGISYQDAFQELFKDKTFREGIQETVQKYAIGGRVGFADGPEDPSKRKFMKIFGGLASLPIVGRFFDVAQVAEKAAPAAVETIKNAPQHFIGLVNKIRALGTEVSPKKLLIPSDRERYSNVYEYGDYTMYERPDGGIEISKDKLIGTDYGDAKVSEEYMSYNPKVPKYNKKGEKIPDEFTDEYEEYTAYADQDGKMKDVQDGVEPETIDEGTYSKEELEQLIVEQIENDLKKGKK